MSTTPIPDEETKHTNTDGDFKNIDSIGAGPNSLFSNDKKLLLLKRKLERAKYIQNFPLQDEILLRFLKIEEYDVTKAMERIELFCIIRCCHLDGISKHFKREINPEVRYYLDSRIFTPLLTPATLEPVIYINLSLWDPDVLSFKAILCNFCNDLQIISEDPRSQSMGISVIIYLENIGRKRTETLLSRANIRDILKIWQEGFPIIHKMIIFCKRSVVIDFIIGLCRMLFRSEALSVIHQLKDNTQRLLEFWPDASTFLPTELGGTADLSTACRSWENKVWDFLSDEDLYSELQVDYAAYLKKVKNEKKNKRRTSSVYSHDEEPEGIAPRKSSM